MAIKRPGLAQVALRRAGATDPTATGTVTSVTSADGSVNITNPTTTPDLSVLVRRFATIGALAATTTLTPGGGLQTGLQAYVATLGGRVYALQAAIGTADNAYIVATADDPTRQWVRLGLLQAPQQFNTKDFSGAEIDLTATGSYQLTPAVVARYLEMASVRLMLVTTGGAYASGPSISIGNNAAMDNIVAITSLAGSMAAPFALGAPVNVANIATNGTIAKLLSLAGAPVFVKVTTPAAGAGLVLTGRFQSVTGMLIPV